MDNFDQKMDLIEKRISRVLKMIATLAGSLVVTVLVCVAGWQQLLAATGKVDVMAAKVDQVDDHLESTDSHVAALISDVDELADSHEALSNKP